MRTSTILISLILAGLAAMRAEAQILRVPADYPTIQAAIDSAVSGDTVLVDEGVYVENLRIEGKSIVLASLFLTDGDTSHVSATVIDGSSPADMDTASTVAFFGRTSGNSVLSGFTISSGWGTVVGEEGESVRAGGGVLCDQSDPTIEYNRITGNRLEGSEMGAGGAGIAAIGDLPGFDILIAHNEITSNQVSFSGTVLGGGVALQMAGSVTDNVITGNSIYSSDETATGGGVVAFSFSGAGLVATIEGNTVRGNNVGNGNPDGYSAGGGIAGQGIRMVIVGNDIADNVVEDRGVGAGAGIFLAELPEDGSMIAGNSISSNRHEGDYGVGGGIFLTLATGILVDANQISDNESGIGGGAMLDETYATIQRNTIVRNRTSDEGGGIWLDNWFIPASKTDASLFDRVAARLRAIKTTPHDDPGNLAASKADARRTELVNNTIADNVAEGPLGAGGVFATIASPELLNSIVWGNEAIDGRQIRGAVIQSYSLVEGGSDGNGNLSDDPLFVDSGSYFLQPTSPAVDAGNPDPQYNDQEDSGNPGTPLSPAQGSLRNDIGATGGPADPTSSVALLGPRFSAFVDLLSTAPPGDKPRLIDSFFVAIGSTPLIEENNVVYFLYSGPGNEISVPGDANSWAQGAFPMTKVSGTDFWYREAVFEPDARLDYKLIVDGNWILDPRNPHQTVGGFGPNSELAMPEFEYPTEIDPVSGTPSGSMAQMTLESAILGNSRAIQVYTPAGYEQAASDSFPVMYFHDGTDYTNLASVRTVLDNLIHKERIVPIIAVFVPPVDRDNEYAFDKTAAYERFVVEEAMPIVDGAYRTMRRPEMRGMTGPSYGGLITTQICHHHSEVFGKCAAISPSYWANDMQVFNEVASDPPAPVQWYVDWGSYELDIAYNGRAFVDMLDEKTAGKEGAVDSVTWNEWPDGHSWGNWRAHMKEFLILFFPGSKATGIDGADTEALPSEFVLDQNYPNPFNPQTTVPFSVARPGWVALRIFDLQGRLVAELANREFAPGRYQVTWDASAAASGVYLYRLEAEGRFESRRLVVLR